jgi:hypothetical protein
MTGQQGFALSWSQEPTAIPAAVRAIAGRRARRIWRDMGRIKGYRSTEFAVEAWLKTDDKFPRLPAIRSLTVDARWLLMVLLSHCAEFETDGAISGGDLPMLLAAAGLKQASKAFQNLLTNGLVVAAPNAVGNGVTNAVTNYYVPLYLEMNRTHEQEEDRRGSARERQKGFRIRHSSNAVSNAFPRDRTGQDSTGVLRSPHTEQSGIDRTGHGNRTEQSNATRFKNARVETKSKTPQWNVEF